MRVRDERGSVSIWALLMVGAITLIVGISVDLTGQIAAKERAHDIAAQAARVAGQQLHPDSVMAGQRAVVDTTRARTAALAYIDAAGMTGTVTIASGGTEFQIAVTGVYRPVFLATIGIGPPTVTGNSTARLARAIEGEER